MSGPLFLLSPVLAECVFVLESFYKQSREKIATALATLISSPGVEMADRDIRLDALQRYKQGKLHFVDCTLAATGVANQWAAATLDRGFKKFLDVRVSLD
jgi:predicted nucleic-acid-binding protein